MNRNIVLCTLAGLLVGAVVGWVLAPKAPENQAQPFDVATAASPDNYKPASPKPKPENPETATPGDGGAGIDVAGWIADVRAGAVRGNGEITGSVKLKDGSPLPGVAIRSTPVFPQADLPPDATLEQEVKAHALQVMNDQAGGGAARTDADGNFRLTGLDESCLHRVEAQLDGYEIGQIGGRGAEHHATGKEAHFLAKAVVWVTADVRMPDGTPAEMAQISISMDVDRPPGWTNWFWTPTDPKRAIEPGEWKLEPRGGVHNEGSAEAISIKLVAGVQHPTLVINLKTRPGITGVVRVPFGDDPNQTRIGVQLHKETDGAHSEVAKDRRDYGDRTRNVGSLWQGKVRFQFLDLEPGAYRVVVLVQGIESVTQDVQVSDGIEQVDLLAAMPEREHFLVARVTGPDGPMDKDVYFRVSAVSGGSRSSGSASALNRGNGEYWIARSELREREGKDYTYTLSAVSTTLGSRDLVVDRESQGVHEFSFALPAFVTVTIAGFDTHPRKSDMHADVRKPGDGRRSSRHMRRLMDDESARAVRRFGPLVPGEYVVELLLDTGPHPEPVTMDSKGIVLKSGEQDVHLTAHELHEFIVVIPPEYRAHQLHLRHTADWDYAMYQGKPGGEEYTFTGLIPGDYELSDRSTGSMIVRMPQSSGQRVTFAPLPYNALRLSYPFRSWSGKDIGFKPGDIVVQMDGSGIANAEQFHKALEDAKGRDSATWVVRRNGTSVTVTFNPKDWNEARLIPEACRAD